MIRLANSVVRDAFYEGVIAWGTGQATITNSVIAGTDRGINVDGTVSVLNSTLHDNRVGIWGHGGSLEMVNSIVSGSIEEGFDHRVTTATDIRNSNVWSATGTNYRGYPDPTGTGGNVSVDPQFLDTAAGDYRLNFESPMIDAADGAAAPEKDHVGTQRHDDPNTDNTGTPTAGGEYADMGAFEFFAGTDPDLAVSHLSVPPIVARGNLLPIEWTVFNREFVAAEGNWTDALYLSADDQLNLGVDEPLGTFDQTDGLDGRTVYHGWHSVDTGAISDGTYYVIAVADSDGAVYEAGREANNVRVSDPFSIGLPTLTPGTPLADTFDVSGQMKSTIELKSPPESISSSHWITSTLRATTNCTSSTVRRPLAATTMPVTRPTSPPIKRPRFPTPRQASTTFWPTPHPRPMLRPTSRSLPVSWTSR